MNFIKSQDNNRKKNVLSFKAVQKTILMAVFNDYSSKQSGAYRANQD